MAQQMITGGNGTTGQTGEEVKDIINENFTELYDAVDDIGATAFADITGDADDNSSLVSYVAAQIAAAVAGLFDLRGEFDASGNAYPSSGGSGSAGAILKADAWVISVAGTLTTGRVVSPGDVLFAKVDSPGSTAANWAIIENNLTYTPVNKAGDSMSGNLAMNANKITGVADPTANQDASTKKYVDDNLFGSAQSGTSIAFAGNYIYGTPSSPITGNLTSNLTGAIVGAVALVIHNDSTIPTFDSNFKLSSGLYITGKVNRIQCTYLAANYIEYSIVTVI